MFPNFAELGKVGDKLSAQFDEIIALLKIIAANTTPPERDESNDG